MLFAGNSLYKPVLSELTPILWELVNFGILVVRPEMTTVSVVFNTWLVDINPETPPVEDLSKTTSLYVVTPTVTLSIIFPVTFDTCAAAPPPDVPVLSKLTLSPTL